MKKYTLFAAILLGGISAIAQNAADRDTSFNLSGLGTPVWGTGGQYSKVTPLDGGKVLVTGSFYSAATTSPKYGSILRLNNDGSFDNTFNAGNEGAYGIIAATAIQADGKILIGGGFPTYNGTSLNGIARINPDGSLDNTFNPGTGFSSIIPPPWVSSIAVQTDGKIIVGGGFTSFNGTAIKGICRLNSDGSLDTTFNSGSGHRVLDVAIQTDGKIIAAGSFGTFNGGTSSGRLVRINTDGTLDNTFSTATSGEISRVIIQPDGKILTSGARVYRVESNGSLDAGFTQMTSGNSYHGLALQQDGKIVLSGFFTTYLSTPRQRIVRLNTDGTVDSEFNSEEGFSTNPNHLAIQPDGKIVVYGGYKYKDVENMVTRITGTYVPTSVSDIRFNTTEVAIYPNPANNFVSVKNIPSGSVVNITDITGKTVYRSAVANVQETINTETFVNGIYFIQIENNGSIANKKLVISK